MDPPKHDGQRKADPSLVPMMVSEIIRYQTPQMHMRRTVTKDAIFKGYNVKKGDKVAMWYVSGNRDADKIDRPDEFIIDRERARNHLSFGFGVHRCHAHHFAPEVA